jgi:Domain of unknown function (DUF4340)
MIRRPTWILLITFLVLVTVVFLWQRSQDQQGVIGTPTTTSSVLLSDEGSSIVGLRISAINGGLLEVKLNEEGHWVLVNLPGETVDETRIESAISVIGGMSALTEIDQPPDFNVIGLDPADYRVRVNFDNGTEQVILIGAETPTQSGYYVVGENESVVVVSGFDIDTLLGLLTDPPVVAATTPDPTIQFTETPQP